MQEVNTKPEPRNLRRSWRDFPQQYIDTLASTAHTIPIRLGPMSWNDARFAQRELHYFFRSLSLAAQKRGTHADVEAIKLDGLAKRLRISCPRAEGKDDLGKALHWVILTYNPIIRGLL